MFKKKIITAILALAACATMLTACGGNTNATTHAGSETKTPATTAEKADGNAKGRNIVNDMKNGVERGMNGIKNSVNNAEDATHGTARGDGRDNETEVMPMPVPMPAPFEKGNEGRTHRQAAPYGK